MFITLLNSAMCLNSWCTLEAMFRFLTFPPFCYLNILKKYDFASILTALFYFVFAKKFDILVRKYVYFMYQVSNISKYSHQLALEPTTLVVKLEVLSFSRWRIVHNGICPN